MNGTKQLLEVTFDRYPTPIPSPVESLRPARYICEGCHTPARFVGEKLLVKSDFADDEKNTETQTVLVLHLGGLDGLSHLTRIHGVHLGHIEYVATDPDPHYHSLGAETQCRRLGDRICRFGPKGGAPPQGERRVMDCIDCHNRAAHTFVTAEEALNRAMAEGAVSPDLPWVHKEDLELLKANYCHDEVEASTQIPQQL